MNLDNNISTTANSTPNEILVPNNKPSDSTLPTRAELLEGFGFFRIAWPIAMENFLYMMIAIVDALILSSISVNAAAGVGACISIVSLTLIAMASFGQGASICISHCFGAGKPLEAQSVARASFIMITLFGMFLGFMQFVLHNHIPTWLGLTGEVNRSAGMFLSIVGGTTVLQAIMIAIAFSLRAYGQPKEPMYVAIFVNIINITLAYSLVKGLLGLPQLGVLGVALATFFARLVGMFIMIYYAKKRLSFVFAMSDFKTDLKKYATKIIKFGVPICLEPLSYQGSQIIITRVIALLGAEALALRTYVWTIISLNVVLVIGFSQATQILLGRLFGAKLYADVKEEFNKNMKLGLITSFGVVTLIWLLGKFILSFFTNDSNMIEMGSTLLAMGYLMEPGRTINIITGAGLRAVGDPKFPLYTGLIFMWGLSIPVAWFFGIYLGFGLLGVWFGLSCDEIVRGIINYRHFQKNKWQKSSSLI